MVSATYTAKNGLATSNHLTSGKRVFERAQKYIPKVSGAQSKRTDVIENTMIRHCDARKNDKPVSINFLRGLLKQLTQQIDAETEQWSKMRLRNRKACIFAAIKGFQAAYAVGDMKAESVRKMCRLNGVILPDEREVTRKAIDGSIFAQIGEARGSISITHNLKGSDFNGARFKPNPLIAGFVPLKRDLSVPVSDVITGSKTVKLFDEKMGKVIAVEVELADSPKNVAWASDTSWGVVRNTFKDRETGKNVTIPNPKRIKMEKDRVR